MKTKILFAALMLTFGAAQAQVNGTTNSEATANGTSAANNAGNSMSLGLTSNSSGTIRNVPSLGGSAYGVSGSPKNCNSTAGVTGVGPGGGASIVGPTENEVCEELLKADTLMAMAVTAHNIGVATLTKDPKTDLVKDPKTEAPKDPKTDEAVQKMKVEIGMAFIEEGARLRAAAYDTLCSTSIRTHKVMSAHKLCSPIVSLLFAAGAADPEQRQPYPQ